MTPQWGINTVANEILWAPWRMGYILGEKSAPEQDGSLELLPGGDRNCFLCVCASSEDDSRHLVVGRDEQSIAVLNRYPYNNGHLLIAPRAHRGRLDELSAREQVALVGSMTRMVGLLEKLMRPDGFNIGLNLGRAAGAGLPGHLHWHVVPRWVGDTNFMPTTAAVRVIPQSLEALWELLREELAAG